MELRVVWNEEKDFLCIQFPTPSQLFHFWATSGMLFVLCGNSTHGGFYYNQRHARCIDLI